MAKKNTESRDDFKQATKVLMRNICGGVCSNPGCRAYTVGANQEGKGSFSNIGVAAHITAAASGQGARRYDPEMTSDERMSISNGIWLCQSCSKLIDTDEVLYTVKLLHEWKRQAETRAMMLIGKRSFGPSEVQSKIVEAVADASQIFYTNAGSFNKVPLAGFVGGYENYLSQLDPRFEVKIVATSSNIRHEVHVRPGQIGKIGFVFTDPEEAELANKGFSRFLDTGENFEINTKSIQFVGSALFDLMNPSGQEGIFTLEPHKKKVPTTLYLKSLEYDSEIEIGSFDSEYFSAGNKLFINGECLGGLFGFQMTYDSKTLQVIFNYNFDREKWKGHSLSNLPGLPKLQKLAKYIAKDNRSKLVVDFNLGEGVLTFGDAIEQDLSEIFNHIVYMVELMSQAKVLADHFNQKISLITFDISQEDETLINIYSQIVTTGFTSIEPMGKELFTLYDPSITLDQLKILNESGFPTSLTINDRTGENFNLFGNNMTSPVFQTVITGFEAATFTDIMDGKRIDALKLYALEGSTIVRKI